jgi:chaperonin GroES
MENELNLEVKEVGEKEPTIQDILKTENICDILDEDDLTEIAQQIVSDYNSDLSSCATRMKELQETMKLAMVVSEQKTYPWTGASNIIFPLISQACIEFGATCYPEIIKDGQVVKAKVIGKDEGFQSTDNGRPMVFPTENPDGSPSQDPRAGKPIIVNIGSKKRRGDRVATAMNFQLMEEQTWWESDTDKLVNSLPAVGDMFKKVYYDPIKEMPVSELIFPDKIIINNGARDIESAIVTQIVELYPQEIMQRIRNEMFCDFDFEYDEDEDNTTSQQASSDIHLNTKVSNNTKLHTFLEQHTWLDLDEDDFPEPYIVTVHSSSSKVVRIVKRFDKDSIKYNKKGEIKLIEAQRYFVHYKFIPSTDGSFFSLGFGHLLLNANNAINTTLNQLIDAGHLSITGGGFISKGFGKTKAGRTALAPGEWKIVDVSTEDLRGSIVPIPHPEPSQVLFSLLGALIDSGKSLGMLSNVLTGENSGNIQATTMISMVEQGMKQFRSIYKRIYKAEKDEFKLLYTQNEQHLTDEKYAEILDEPVINVDVKSDFSLKGYDICPVADVDAVTNFQRMAMAQFYMSFLNDPFVDPVELRRRIFGAANVEDLDKLVVQPQPQPNPLVEIEQLKQQTKMAEIQSKAEAEYQKSFIDSHKIEAEIEKIKADAEVAKTQAIVNLATAGKLAKETDLKEQTESIKVLDNQLDQQTKKMEVEGRMRDMETKFQIEDKKLKLQLAKMGHEHMQNINKMSHEHTQNELNRQHKMGSQTQEANIGSQSDTKPE